MEEAEILLKNIDQCLLPKLAVNYDDSETHAEYDTRNNNLEENVKVLFKRLEKFDLKKSLVDDTAEALKTDRITIIASLFNLYKELLCDCSWNTDKAKELAKKFNDTFQAKYGIKLGDVIKVNEFCEYQEVFDKILDGLSLKLTAENYKKYPGQIEVYCDLTQKLKDYSVSVQTTRILRIALFLIDDHIESNKIKGLLCCQSVLNKLTAEDFENGNYYDVIHLSVKSARQNKDIKITELSQACSLQLCKFFPSDVKDEKLEEMYSDALEQLSMESNLYRKAAIFKYMKYIMEMLQIKCVGNSLFKTVICDNIESCLTDAVSEILLIPSLQCLEKWIKYCWPVWKLSVDFKILCALLKYYSKCNTGEGGLFVQRLIITLVALCTPEEQREFIAKLADYDDNDNVDDEDGEDADDDVDDQSSDATDDQNQDEPVDLTADSTGYIEDLTEDATEDEEKNE